MQLDDPRTKDEDIYGCTCNRDEEFIDEHTCPFAEDINNDFETLCRCCDYCTYQCTMDI